MTRTIVDIIFAVAILIGISYRFFFTHDMTVGEFYIALILNFVGARYLLMSDLDLALFEVAETNNNE